MYVNKMKKIKIDILKVIRIKRFKVRSETKLKN